ncbi:katanin p60 ATPase-containing subunit [Thraustotheca clavata]|uniref:Katanin p60 ATPase-containing subunit n=1 Tax=Thraustotheca clavata TaxID=74557 RepID=A0A1W0A106_9STRA|nr:katanin p60 ATPase-containing subunit [Thraustotheca clavata]
MEDVSRRVVIAREECLVGRYESGCKLFRECIQEAMHLSRLNRDPLTADQWKMLVDDLKSEFMHIHRYTASLSMLQKVKFKAKKPLEHKDTNGSTSRPLKTTLKRLGTEEEFVGRKRPRKTKEIVQKPKLQERQSLGSNQQGKMIENNKPKPKHPYLKRNSISYTLPVVDLKPKAKPSPDLPVMESLAQNSLLKNDRRYISSPRTSTDSSDDSNLLKFSDIARSERRVDIDLIDAIERDIVDRGAKVQFEDIAGLEHVKNLLKEAVMLPRFAPHLFSEDGPLKPCNGVLLFGPPGTGKTLLAKAVANVCQTTFFNVSASTLASKYRGESERMVRILFEMARYYAPSIIFMDEIDAIAGTRGSAQEHEASRRVKTELLVQMNGIVNDDNGQVDASKQVMVLAATNLPWELDEAMRRRLTKRVCTYICNYLLNIDLDIPLPGLEGRKELFKLNLRKMTLAQDIVLNELAKQTEGYSGDDITNLCEAAKLLTVKRVYTPQLLLEMQAKSCSSSDLKELREQSLVVTKSDFKMAVGNVSKSVGSDELHRFHAWEAEFGSK